MQQWQKPGHALHLALDTTVLWNRFCVVVISVVCHGRAIPLLWQTLEHPSASVCAEVVIALLERADRLLSGFDQRLGWRWPDFLERCHSWPIVLSPAMS